LVEGVKGGIFNQPGVIRRDDRLVLRGMIFLFELQNQTIKYEAQHHGSVSITIDAPASAVWEA